MKLFAICLQWACLALACSFAHAQSPQTTQQYKALYARAYKLSADYPDSTIHYAHQAAQLEGITPAQRAKAYWLAGYYSRIQGYYGFALQHYQKAYELHPKPISKAQILVNMAVCYRNSGNYNKAIPIAERAVERFRQLADSSLYAHALQILGNCYTLQLNLGAADTCFKAAVKLANKPTQLASIYTDYACVKANLKQYPQAIAMQRQALKDYPQPNPNKTSLRLIHLAEFYLRGFARPDSALHFIERARALQPKSYFVRYFVEAMQGVYHLSQQQDSLATARFARADSVLEHMAAHSDVPVQKKFARKLGVDAYELAQDVLHHLYTYGGKKPYYKQKLVWARQRLQAERLRFTDIKLSVTLQDSLVIERAKPKTHMITRLTPWGWALLLGALGLLVGIVYTYRIRQLQAGARFLEALKHSPIKGFDQVSLAEVNSIEEIQDRMRKQLKPETIKILLLIGRGYNYNQISQKVGLTVGNIKSRVKRVKDECKVGNVRELLVMKYRASPVDNDPQNEY